MRKLKNKIILPVLMAAAICVSGCSAYAENAQAGQTAVYSGASADTEAVTLTASTAGDSSETEYFSARDLATDVDLSEAVSISLNGSTASADSGSVRVSGSTVTITEEGIYVLSGTLEDGCVIVDAGEDAKVQLVLNGVSVSSDDFAAIYVASADKVFVTLADGTKNTLSNGGTFTAIDDSNVDAVIWSRDDITLNGTGALTITSPAGHGIAGKDDVTVTGGSYTVSCSGTAIKANDNIDIADGVFTLTAGSDGLHAENDEDNTTGAVYIAGGTFTIQAGDDGIHATTTLQIDGGSFAITASEGLEATYVIINDGEISINASDDGINAAQKSSLCTPTVEINGGELTIVMGSGDTDGIDANGIIVINGGTVDVTGNSAFDYNVSGTINGGTVISNGTQITTLTNQMMGGHGSMGGMQGGMSGGMQGGPGGSMNGSTDSGMQGGMGHGGMNHGMSDATSGATVSGGNGSGSNV